MAELESDMDFDEADGMLLGKEIYKTLARTTYLDLDTDIYDTALRDYDGTYRPNRGMEVLYEYLCKLGYKASDEEWEMIDGTHRAYLKD